MPHDPATTSTARSSGASPSALRTAARSIRLSRNRSPTRGPCATRVLAAALSCRLGRELTDGKVTVDARVDPERVDREVGEIGDDGNAELLRASACVRGRVTRAGTPTRSCRDGSALIALRSLRRGQPRVDHDGRGTEERCEPVVELVAPREVPELHEVEPAHRRPDVERDRVEEIDDFDSVAATLEPPAKLLGRAVVPRAHRRGDDQDAPTHGQERTGSSTRGAGTAPRPSKRVVMTWRARWARTRHRQRCGWWGSVICSSAGDGS